MPSRPSIIVPSSSPFNFSNNAFLKNPKHRRLFLALIIIFIISMVSINNQDVSPAQLFPGALIAYLLISRTVLQKKSSTTNTPLNPQIRLFALAIGIAILFLTLFKLFSSSEQFLPPNIYQLNPFTSN